MFFTHVYMHIIFIHVMVWNSIWYLNKNYIFAQKQNLLLTKKQTTKNRGNDKMNRQHYASRFWLSFPTPKPFCPVTFCPICFVKMQNLNCDFLSCDFLSLIIYCNKDLYPWLYWYNMYAMFWTDYFLNGRILIVIFTF
jgi:hypothetical protein